MKAQNFILLIIILIFASSFSFGLQGSIIPVIPTHPVSASAQEISSQAIEPDPDDIDGDGIPNDWEIWNELNPEINDADLDYDNDGLTNIEEYRRATNPRDDDTDGDRIKDSEDNFPLDPHKTKDDAKVSSTARDISMSELIGDFNHDGCVEFDDFLEFSDVYGTDNPSFNLDNQGTVDNFDFTIFLGNYGKGCIEKMQGIIYQRQEASCNIKDYKMAFIFLENAENPATSIDIESLDLVRETFSNKFAFATRNLATMDTSYPVVVLYWQGDTENIKPNEVTSLFYQNNPDNFHFLSIYSTFEKIAGAGAGHISVQNKIRGIGKEIFDISEFYHSNGKLLGFNFMGNVRKYKDNDDFIIQFVNILLHETGHQWCCYVGDNFAEGRDNARLEIIQQGIHFYSGLQSPSEDSTPMGSRAWTGNNDGTFKRIVNPKDDFKKYHPFQLYLMGLLSKDEYDNSFSVYDAGISPNMNWNNAPPFKEVSVNDIIEVEGERIC